MAQGTSAFTMTTLERKRAEKFRRKDKDARVHARLSALLWLADGRTADQGDELAPSHHSITCRRARV